MHRKSLPHTDYIEHYLVNVWLGMEFLENQKLCDEPKIQIGIKPRLQSIKSIVNYK